MRFRCPLLSRRDVGWVLAIGLLALGLRFLYATEYITHPLGRLLWVDETVYWERARAFLGGRWLPDRPFFQDPLIHCLLAGVMSLPGTEVIIIRFGPRRVIAAKWGVPLVWAFLRDDVAAVMTERG